MQVDELVDALALHGDGVRVGERHQVRIGRRRDVFTVLHLGEVRLSILGSRRGSVRAVAVTAGCDPGLGPALAGIAGRTPVLRRFPRLTLLLGRPSQLDDDDPEGAIASQCRTNEIAGVVSIPRRHDPAEPRHLFVLPDRPGVEAVLEGIATGDATAAVARAGLDPEFADAITLA